MFHSPEFDLSVGVHTAARAPFVFVLSGDSIEGKARGDAWVPGREIVVDARGRFRSTGRNSYIKINQERYLCLI